MKKEYICLTEKKSLIYTYNYINMKKVLLTLIAPVALFFASCGGHSTEEESTENLKEIKFSVSGDSLSIMIPNTMQGIVEITEQAWGATEIKIGTKFQVSVEPNNGDIALQKGDIESNDVYKFQRYITDEPTLLFWESKIPDMAQSNFHFYLIQKDGENTYVIKDVDSGEAYSESDVKTMVDAAKRLKNKSAKGPDA